MVKNSSYWINSGINSLIERISILLFGITGFVLLVRLLDKESYGIWMLFLTIITLVETARHGFFKNPLIKNIHTSGEKPEEVQFASFIIHLVLNVAVALLLWGLSFQIEMLWDAPGMAQLFLLNLIISVFQVIFFHGEYVSKGYMEFAGSAWGYFSKGLFFVIPLSVHYALKVPLTLYYVGVYYSIATILSAILMWIFTRKHFKLNQKFQLSVGRELIHYGKYTLGTNLSAMLMRYTDTWMIGIYLNPIAVASYNVAVRIANLFELPSMALANILYPQAVKQSKIDGNDSFKKLYEVSVAAIVMIVTPLVIFAILFSDPIIYLLAGTQYAESADLLKITMLYGLIVPFNKQMGILLDAYGKAKTNMFFVIRNTVINIVLNAIAIPYFGIIGAAYATLSTFLIILVINQNYLNKNYKIKFLSVFNEMLLLIVKLKARLSSKPK